MPPPAGEGPSWGPSRLWAERPWKGRVVRGEARSAGGCAPPAQASQDQRLDADMFK